MRERNFGKKTAWLVGLGLSLCLMTAMYLWGDLRYLVNDDATIARQYMGFGTGEIPRAHMFLHPLLSAPLRALSVAVPGVAWFSWIQLALLTLGGAVSVKAVVVCFQNRGLSAAWGALAGAVYLLLFWTSYACHVNFSVTAAVLGAAAVLQLCSLDGERDNDGRIVGGMLLALALVMLCYALRQVCALPVLAFCALALARLAFGSFGIGKKRRRSWKPLWIGVCAAAVAFAALPLWRSAELKTAGMEEYLLWQDANGAVVDYYDVSSLTEEQLAVAGWSQAEADALQRWFFMDENFTAESFQRLAALLETEKRESLSDALSRSLTALTSLTTAEPVATRSALALCAVLLLCAVGLLLRRKDALWQTLALLAGTGGAALLLLYLGWNGRLPLRAALQVILPLAALVFGLTPSCLPQKTGRWGRTCLCALGALVLALSAAYAVPACRALAKNEEEGLEAFAALDELAASDPDSLYIYDGSLVGDTRMFPDTQYGAPDNLLFWGGWTFRSPEMLACLERFGVSPQEIDESLFLRDDVYLARGMIDPEPAELLRCVAEKEGCEPECVLDGEYGGVYTFQLYGE